MSLWLTDYKIASGGAWSGRRVLVLVGGEAAGHLDFLVHPDGRAVSVWGLEVYPEYRRRNLASVMMDAMYAAYPTAWVNHGGRLRAGALWWDGYSDPASERNVHNRPPSEWAEYFSSVEVAACKAQNAYMNRNLGVDGHREAEYRYGQRWEEEARQYAAFYREARVQGPDPAVDELFAGLRLALPPGMHRLVHNSALPTEDRAGILLNHVGHGNLPADQAWNTTERAAFEDLAQDKLLSGSSPAPETHVTFHALPLTGNVPDHEVKATWVTYVNSPGVPLQLSGMSWRAAHQPWVTHSVAFTPPQDAAIQPAFRQATTPEYRARYDEIGRLRPGAAVQRSEEPHPYAERAEDIRAVADGILHDSARRTVRSAPPQTAVRDEERAASQDQRVHQSPVPPPSPRVR